MVPTADVERTSVDLCASLADSGTSVVVDGSAKVLRALVYVAMKPKTKGFRLQPSLCLCWGWQVWSTIDSLDLGSK